MKIGSLKIPLTFLLLLIPTIGFAASIFESVPTDASIHYLSLIFGQVENVLDGVGNPISKVAMTTFNYAVLTLGGIIIMYSLIVSTVNTAHEGEMLGKEWNSIWIPLRTAFGFSLLLPVKAKSYTIIQVFMMWVITQGVYAADNIWNTGLEAISKNAITNPTFKLDNPENGVPNEIQAQSIFTSLVCAKLLPPAEAVDAQGGTPSPWREVSNINSKQINFGPASSNSNAPCGSLPLDSSDKKDEINPLMFELVDSLDREANQFVTHYAQDATYYNQANNAQTINSNIRTNAASFFNETLGLSQNNKSNGLNSQEQKAINAAKQAGWIYAGSFFLALSKMMSEQSQGGFVTLSPTSYDVGAAQNIAADPTGFISEMSAAQNIGGASPATSMQSVDGFSDIVKKTGFGVIQNIMMGLFKLFGLAGTGGTGNAFPITHIQKAGIWIIRANGGIFIGVGAIEAIALAATCGAANTWIPGLKQVLAGACTTIKYVVMFTILPFFALMGALYAIGITMAYYIPLIPFLIFTMGGIGWFILVIEAMVAAPLIAIGIIHPEGKHTVFGEAYQGIMIIASVFLRPCLMIVGLFISFVFVYVVVLFITVGFTPMVELLAAKEWSIIGLLVMMAIYVMLITIGLNKAFSIIYVLPNQIMRWIGGSPESHAPEQELHQIKDSAHEGPKAGGEVTGKVAGDYRDVRNEEAQVRQQQSGGPTSQQIS